MTPPAPQPVSGLHADLPARPGTPETRNITPCRMPGSFAPPLSGVRP